MNAFKTKIVMTCATRAEIINEFACYNPGFCFKLFKRAHLI